MRLKVRQNKFGENSYGRNCFIKKSLCHTFPVFQRHKRTENVWRAKKAILRNSKKLIPSLVYLSCEHELICLVYEGESL